MEPVDNNNTRTDSAISHQAVQSPAASQTQDSHFHHHQINQPVVPTTLNKPGLIILQWLTYAFWGWTIVALASLLGTTLSHMITGADTSNFTPYGISAVVVLLPIAAVCDYFYAKHETVKKTGPSTIVMILHAVLFALLAIGSLIGAVFSVIAMLTSSSDTKTSLIALILLVIVSVIYAATFLRVLNPEKAAWLRKSYLLFMIVVTVIVVTLSIYGPIRYELTTKNDRLISENLPEISTDISNYSVKNGRLPAKLSDLDVRGENAKRLVNSNLIEYTPDILSGSTSQNSTSTVGAAINKTYDYTTPNQTINYYQLCVTYKKASGPAGRYSEDNSVADENGYSSYLYISTHPAGNICYKLKTE